MDNLLEDFEDDDIYALDAAADALGVLHSTLPVVEQGENVWINQERLEQLARSWAQSRENTRDFDAALWNEQYHFNDNTERTVNWVLLLDALNFCFWAEKGQPRWQIEYKGETLNGYWAEAASLKRAVEEGIPLWDATYLSSMSSEDLAHIFRGKDGSPAIPLFAQRLENAREVGRVLLERYEGQFARFIEQAGGSAPRLVALLAENFASFNDVTTYRGQEVRFYKRAQICVADLYGTFGGKNWGAFFDIERLTAFADYKLPQVLRHYGVLEYSPALAERIDNEELIPTGSEEEIELRAATIWASELLRRELARQRHPMTPAEIDQRLWLLGQIVSDMKPYHRTRTIYY
ncbi:MAG TPA: queuosine salvage family protein [Ktedonobacteraceae bacterium]|nr:queuosine salvage family protein [Ktedonobacteraceae bacterium]